ncbi:MULTISPECIES: DUF4254 domain-containing protein [unclassified Pseudodesulfovibrio]|uniref:DUF4254 domain-containing protein n=1 Tax=unclassified Pseudodesulfovibrio TaxID=2661612 RepID=UPI000FEB662F|nr:MULTISPECIES: DUF4254 domain-containing protein [unclassified Pseudodesulfovibrio]MCJ2163194.1 DUF4254 domain-containing protein [Pseudodesulfovibrio sp. S3-i]RWU07179.1 DUF4254 domain-containing protein [Pseudodesulfovibrio sp. S3]
MAEIKIDTVKGAIKDAIAHQIRSVTDWHFGEPVYDVDPAGDLSGVSGLRELIGRQHWANFQLWHVEDRARRKDVDAKVIADCKYAIDKLNQKRNDLIERVDECLINLMESLLPPDAPEKYNTETIGAALDRLSIQALKIYHMKEQCSRRDVDQDHVNECNDKVSVLQRQHDDLAQAILELLDEYFAGSKKPKVYFQFKMYNDPRLNPELYANKK